MALRPHSLEHGQNKSLCLRYREVFTFILATVGRETLQFQSALIPADITFTVTPTKGKQLVLLLDDFHSGAHQL